MLLILTNSEDATANYLCSRLTRENLPYLRLNSDTAVQCCRIQFSFQDGPLLSHAGRRYRPEDFTLLWYRRPQSLRLPFKVDLTEETQIVAEWSEALEGFLAHIPNKLWMNHPAANAMASHKIEQLARAKAGGISVPETLLTQELSELKAFWDKHNGCIITKPLAAGYLERDDSRHDTVIFTQGVENRHLTEKPLCNCPTLFQERIHKFVDVRISIIDDFITAVGLRALDAGEQRLDIRRNNMEDVEYSKLDLSQCLKDNLITLVRSYGLRFAAIDMAIDNQNNWIFFEINPNGQWAWLDLVGGCDIAIGFINSLKRTL